MLTWTVLFTDKNFHAYSTNIKRKKIVGMLAYNEHKSCKMAEHI